MADEFVVLSPNVGIGSSVAVDRVGGIDYQLTKIAFSIDGVQPAHVSSVDPFPVTLGLTDTQLRAVPVPVSVSTSVLPTGASTSALQTTGNTSVASIDTKTPALGQAVMLSSVPVVIASNQSAVPVSGTVTTTPPSNASTNVAQLAGTATSVNSGTKDAGTLRVVLATDQPVLTNKLLVTPDSVALPANQSVNVSQVNAITVLTGTGATGTGSQRVTVATDSATVAGSASIPTGSNVIGSAVNRGAAKGATVAADITSTPQSADRQGMDVQIRTSTGVAVDTFGGGTQFADGAARGTGTGTIAMVDDGTNIQSMKGDTSGRPAMNLEQIFGTNTSVNQGVADAGTMRVAVNNEQVQDLYITGQGSQSAAGNNILLATAGSGSTDTVAASGLVSYRSFYVQVNGSAGIASGQIIFEGSNDNTFTTAHAIPTYDAAAMNTPPVVAAITIAASTQRYFCGKTFFRYVRCRISTVFAGGTVQAYTRLSIADFTGGAQIVTQSAVANLNMTAAQSGTWTVQPGNTANTTAWKQQIDASAAATGGTSIGKFLAAATTNAVSLKASAGRIYGWEFTNNTAAVKFFRLYNKASAPTVGTDSPIYVIMIPANGHVTFAIPAGIAHTTGIAYSCTNAIADLDATAVAANDVIGALYYL